MSQANAHIEPESQPRMVMYEHPLQERIRTFLRLENLFRTVEQHLPEPSIWSSRAAMNAMQGMLAIFSRSDLKTEILKELKRHIQTFTAMQQTPGVDAERLEALLSQLNMLNELVYRQEGQLGQNLRNNDFLKSVGQRSSIPGGDCVFDIPQYHCWLQQAPELRHQDLNQWMSELTSVRDAIVLVLQLIRSTAETIPKVAKHGSYQETLGNNIPGQLLRVAVQADMGCYPEISGSKHRISIRFMSPGESYGKCMPLDYDIPFQMTLCSI